ncbi:hypothetical protein CAter282_3091 [Collimonas arenae]|uniref:Proline-rich protein n=2 Tax=Collimonas arenae TaxID=279058 RepID=A0A127QL63_9BURK|nr:hypothetical protein [Collimonas arenae]AMP10800.1 hypothetical protein CAter282_3091 [Collimonas arenae]
MIIFDKTEQGRAEIATRGQTVGPRLRTLLLLVDGKTADDELLRKVAGLGLGQEHLDELLQAGLIQISSSPATHAAAPIATASITTTTPPAAPAATASTPKTAAVGTALSAEQILPPGQTQFEAIYHFYNDTIKSMIGLRGYGLQLKVERASSVQDFRELRQAYLEAVLKSKGEEIARSLRGRLDQLLYLGERGPTGV